MLKHSEKKKTTCVSCILLTFLEKKKQLFFSRLNEKTKAWSPHWSCFQHCCSCLLSSCCWIGLRSSGTFLPDVERGRETWFTAGFGICSIPWAEQSPPQTKLHFPRISAQVKFGVFNWYHQVHRWKITGQE